MFRATLFITIKIWKLKYLSVVKWINKECYIQTMDYYSAIKQTLHAYKKDG